MRLSSTRELLVKIAVTRCFCTVDFRSKTHTSNMINTHRRPGKTIKSNAFPFNSGYQQLHLVELGKLTLRINTSKQIANDLSVA